MANQLTIIDADAHVIETERTWDYLPPSEQKFRPKLYSSPTDPTPQYWVIDDKIAGFRFLTLNERELHEFAQRAGRNFETPQAARELDDVALRLKHMDELGIDIQVLHNTFWIERVTTRSDAEVALCRSWNRWLAQASGVPIVARQEVAAERRTLPYSAIPVRPDFESDMLAGPAAIDVTPVSADGPAASWGWGTTLDDQGRPWGPLFVTAVILFLSVGLNCYLAWISRGLYERYKNLVFSRRHASTSAAA